MNATSAAETRWSADRGCCTLDCAFGKILIEGAIFHVENQRGRQALDRLAALIDRDGPSAIARAEGDFVAIVVTDRETYAFKSFTSQYQIYYREREMAQSPTAWAFSSSPPAPNGTSITLPGTFFSYPAINS